tara:strand:+ start:34113 stop:34346 length:234 start_codon:yes stop_codon:yes gene_type:complete
MTDVHEVLTCCLCEGPIEHKTTTKGEIYWTQGNNPWPLADEGRCCDVCVNTKVLTMRFIAERLTNGMMTNITKDKDE